jgi:nitrite reductase/ring-hydroxylating ferredoxin subunit
MTDGDAYPVCPAADLGPGEKRIVDCDGRSIGVYNVDGEYYAITNVCPHQRAPLCEGELTGTTQAEEPGEMEWERDGQIAVCPWHGWEFDVTTGESVFNPHRWRVTSYETDVVREPVALGEEDAADPGVDTYPVSVEDGTVVVYI